MGMSGDFEVAIEEGATLLIGSGLFREEEDMASMIDKILGFLGVQDEYDDEQRSITLCPIMKGQRRMRMCTVYPPEAPSRERGCSCAQG